MYRKLAIIAACTALVGCAQTIPVAVIGQHGEIMRGSNSFGLSGGSFTVSNGQVSCTGTYNALNESQTITMPVVCMDGRTGIATAVRDSPTSGGGTVTLSDGTSGRFIFGPAASRI